MHRLNHIILLKLGIFCVATGWIRTNSNLWRRGLRDSDKLIWMVIKKLIVGL